VIQGRPGQDPERAPSLSRKASGVVTPDGCQLHGWRAVLDQDRLQAILQPKLMAA
jgi:hypothetical protein